jgi:hypothetical protein
MDIVKEYILSNNENSKELLNIILQKQNPKIIRNMIINLGVMMKDFKLISMVQDIKYLGIDQYIYTPLQFNDINFMEISDDDYAFKLIDIIFAQNENVIIDINKCVSHKIYKKIVSNIIKYTAHGTVKYKI